MKSNVVILNSFPLKFAPFSEWLNTSGEYNIYLFTIASSLNLTKDNAKEELNKYKSYIILDDYRSSYEFESRVIELASRIKIHAIIALSEYDLKRVADLRKVLGVAGQSQACAQAYLDKFVMKSKIKNSSIRVPTFKSVESIPDLLESAVTLGFPFILKPRYGAGSVGFELVKDDRAMRNLMAKKLSYSSSLNMIAEEYIEGSLFHVDGLLCKGKLVSLWPSQYQGTCLNHHEGKNLVSKMLGKVNPLTRHLINATNAVISTLPSLEASAIHAEFFLTPSNEIVFCEIASRVGGARVNSCYEVTMGINLNEESLKSQVGVFRSAYPKEPTNDLSGWMLVVPRKARLLSAPSVCPLPFVEDFDFYGTVGKTYSTPTSSIDSIASVVVKGSNEKEVDNNLGQLAQWVDKKFLWD